MTRARRDDRNGHPAQSTQPHEALSDIGVSIWLDDLSRERITTGDLARLIADRNVVGVTTNPTIFARALSKGNAYRASSLGSPRPA